MGGYRDIEVIRSVTDAAGNKTDHYFAALQYDGSTPVPDPRRLWVHGLPYSPLRPQGSGLRQGFLSREVFTGTGQSRKRQFWVRYERDRHPGSTEQVWDINRRVAYEKTRYIDGNSHAEVRRTNYDGLGHYRQIDTFGDFGRSDRRIEFTNFNPSGQAPGIGSFWLLNLFDQTTQTEGARKEKQTYCFDGRGFLKRQRTYKSSGGASVDDVVMDRLRDGDGNLKRERFFGGDTRSVSTSGNLCGLVLADWAYALSHTYQFGSRKRSTYRQSDTATVAFHSLDTDIDSSTGLVKTSRDVSGQIATALEYDNLGRIQWIKPPVGHGSWIEYIYRIATGSASAQAEIRRHNNNTTGGTLLSHDKISFDLFGRVTKEEERMPSGAWAFRDTLYNAMGWKTHVSERRSTGAAQWTKFENFDPFGRPRRIVPPDTDSHEILLSYGGVKTIRRTVKVRQAGSAVSFPETAVTTTEIYDRQGRLWTVQEPAGGLSATYQYDVGGRLIEADLFDGGSTHQRRFFTYDGRGFLTRECHPELGTSQTGGCIDYAKIDARGHATERNDHGNALKFIFDRAERLTRVLTASNVEVKKFEYATANSGADLRKGRLHKAIRHNRGEAPWAPGNFGDIVVTEVYAYGGRDGRVSKRSTNVGPDVKFSQAWEYDAMGNVTKLTYPRCTTADCLASNGGPFRQQQFSYKNGRMTAASGFVNGITYHPSGLIHEVRHANNTTHKILADASGMARPADIRLKLGTGQEIGFGLHRYDGAGNLTVRGSEYFLYDALSRIKRYQRGDGSYQTYSHNVFGNLTAVTTFKGGVTETRTMVIDRKNQLASAGYDGRGNMTSWANERYRWDEMDMLFQRDFPQDTYIYTADDERIFRLWWDGTTIHEIYRLRNLDNQVLRMYERELIPGGTAQWTWHTDYFHDPTGRMLLSVNNKPFPNRNQHYATDHLGSPLITTDQQGNIYATDSIWAYGEENEVTGPRSRRRFTGHERNADLSGRIFDLDYMHAREYSPHLGRFLSVDPARQSVKPLLPQSWNRYAYGQNNPMRFIDRDGRIPIGAISSLGFAIANEALEAEFAGLIASEADGLEQTNFMFDVMSLAAGGLPTLGLSLTHT